ncbi:MAG: MlaD family protein [Rhizobiaceae bacterium]|nr:MlaD family protein [Rhizobiaceae bacterium]MDF2373529.1 MlaD family protein [Rhizobiaceae bacterium]|tara:strand:+ start:10101 stop:11474 length:1374 start_codon:yes stop_codon:yes gene_type:complete
METKANYTIVGVFTLAVIFSAFGFVYWMATYGKSGEMAQLEIRIPGSASGLSVSAPVLFNGIRIGSVTSLTIDGVDPNYVLAMTEVRASAPVFATTKAKLGIQGLTGQSHIELSGGDTGGDNILEQSVERGSYATLTAEESSVTNLLATAEDILSRVDKAVTGIEEFVTASKGPLAKTVENAEQFSAALAENSDGVSDFLKSASSLASTLKDVSGTLEGVMTKAEALVAAVEPARVSAIVKNVEKISSQVADASSDFQPMLEEFKTAATNLSKLGENADVTLGRVDTLVAAVDPAKITQTVDDVSAASVQARQGIASLVTVADTIGNRNEDIDAIITNVNQLSGRLNDVALKVQATLDKLDGVMGDSDAEGLVTEAKKTLKTFQEVANTINAHVGPIAENLQRFSGTGLRDFEALISEARRSVTRIERTISEIGSQPQSLLFGTSGEVKQFDGRRRR